MTPSCVGCVCVLIVVTMGVSSTPRVAPLGVCVDDDEDGIFGVGSTRKVFCGCGLWLWYVVVVVFVFLVCVFVCV